MVFLQSWLDLLGRKLDLSSTRGGHLGQQRWRLILIAAGVALIPLVPTSGRADTFNLSSILNDPTPTFGDRFGAAVAISGNNIVVVAISGNNVLISASTDEAGGLAVAGRAFLFDAVSGNLLQTFSAPSPGFGDQFGSSAAISGDNVLIGAANAGASMGQAFLPLSTYAKGSVAGWPAAIFRIFFAR